MRNVDVFSSESSIERYTEQVYEDLYPHEEAVIDAYFTRRDATVLDLGCGAGRTVRHLLERGFDVVGLDISEPMTRRGSDLLPESPFVTATASDLPFRDGEFQYILFSFNGLDYLEPASDRRRALREIERVLKPGGMFAFSSHNSWITLPANPTKPGSWLQLCRFWISNWRQNQLTTRYKHYPSSYGTPKTYYINPAAQKRQLRDHGFEVVDVRGRFGSGYRTWIDPWPYYVASKRPSP